MTMQTESLGCSNNGSGASVPETEVDSGMGYSMGRKIKSTWSHEANSRLLLF